MNVKKLIVHAATFAGAYFGAKLFQNGAEKLSSKYDGHKPTEEELNDIKNFGKEDKEEVEVEIAPEDE